jgi:hypothetical protein
MMGDPVITATIAAAALAAFLVAAVALLRGWNDWLAFKRAELDAQDVRPASPTPAARIELADLKERVRRLEAIANGVEG